MSNHQEGSSFRTIWLTVAILLALLTLALWLMGHGPGGRNCPTCGTTAVAAAPAPAVVPAPEPEPEGPSFVDKLRGLVDVEEVPTARVYFDVDEFSLPADVDTTLAEIVAYMGEHDDVITAVSGYHDPTGDAAHNDELARNRALSVRSKLIALGVPADRIDLRKPLFTTGSGDLEEARRVEVHIRR